jgi:hypothetical protein
MEGLMSEFISLLEMRAELLARSKPDANWLRYWRQIGPLDHATVAANAGALHVLPVRFHSDRTFDFQPDGSGVLSAILEVLDTDGEGVIDVIAWPVHRPDKFATAVTAAEALGLAQVEDPSSYAGGRPLRVWRNPENWLRNGCSGVVIINPRSSPRWLSAAAGNIAGEDVEHARELARQLHGYFPAERLLAPLLPKSKVAA